MKMFIATAIVALVVLAAGFILVGLRQPTQVSVSETVPRVLTPNETDPSVGRRDAPVTVIIAASFTCPHCREESAVLDQIAALYPDKVRIIWKDLPESYEESFTAAIAARCAQQQGRFWQYRDLLFTKRELLSALTLYPLWAKQLGLLQPEFERCFQTQETRPLVEYNISEALASGISGVPYVQVDDEPGVQGTIGLAQLRGMIDSALAQAPSANN
ncbi:MAG: hypothetical protein A3B30_01200 [Candidatus Komeilibacteria bacterium RIFCSPLOWO2_01_FULL_52_15]|uniref:Thioredoxin domain-containing protein n=2 Tax=Candidatus Komeiliibacteriota TaxID=1817908 RepID=A0A1G2BTH8_9BACT|nr:MAG: hypothetical protein A2677_02415 [Candidatus Komeilibacteria bacterium RIFCSPHIGHO2_01_FULL_52_14]OGY91879.1 MAG: hypothetical protein A3B30_01200 [Candidatus Komeilibacteria bacterium RIFCSPLOWO2_01_FULL_52_15]